MFQVRSVDEPDHMYMIWGKCVSKLRTFDDVHVANHSLLGTKIRVVIEGVKQSAFVLAKHIPHHSRVDG
jgi:hypothetical protein